MAKCEVCGNEYEHALKVIQGKREATFDSFECAIHAMAPRCSHCDCRIIGHGIDACGKLYCCEHCAKHSHN